MLLVRLLSLGSKLIFTISLMPLLLCARIVSVPDLHGDYDRAVRILSAANLIDLPTLAWVGGDATLVQTGDIVDRGDYGLEIYNLFQSLADQAEKAGGKVVNLLGNHELMNIQGDLRYVSAGDVQTYGGLQNRTKSWSKDGSLGNWLRKQKAVVKVGHVLFSHAGLHPSFLKGGRSIDQINQDVQQAIATTGRPSDRDLAHLLEDAGPLWTRFFAEPQSEKLCAVVGDVLEQTGTDRMVVGHTIQTSDDGLNFHVNSDCDGSLILGDTGISRAYGGVMSFIEHDKDGGAIVKYPTEDRTQLMQQVVLPDRPRLIRSAKRKEGSIGPESL